MKRLHIITNIILIIVAFMLQSMLFVHVSFPAVKPNLLLIVTVLSGFLNGKKEGILVGFGCGLVWDIFCHDILGFYALIFLIIGYINGRFQKTFFGLDVRLPLMLTAVSDFGFGMVVCITQFFLRGRFSFGTYLFRVILPEMLFTTIVLLIVYPLMVRMNQMIREREQRSSGKFV